MLGVDGTNVEDLTGLIWKDKASFEALEFMRRFIQGVITLEVVEVADQVGVRESRRIQGEYY